VAQGFGDGLQNSSGGMKKCSLFNVRFSFVIGGGASRSLLLVDAAPKAHPKMTNESRTLNNEHFFIPLELE
jgi:hypothetical protein